MAWGLDDPSVWEWSPKTSWQISLLIFVWKVVWQLKVWHVCRFWWAGDSSKLEVRANSHLGRFPVLNLYNLINFFYCWWKNSSVNECEFAMIANSAFHKFQLWALIFHIRYANRINFCGDDNRECTHNLSLHVKFPLKILFYIFDTSDRFCVTLVHRKIAWSAHAELEKT